MQMLLCKVYFNVPFTSTSFEQDFLLIKEEIHEFVTRGTVSSNKSKKDISQRKDLFSLISQLTLPNDSLAVKQMFLLSSFLGVWQYTGIVKGILSKFKCLIFKFIPLVFDSIYYNKYFGAYTNDTLFKYDKKRRSTNQIHFLAKWLGLDFVLSIWC